MNNNIGFIYCFTSPSGKCYIGQTWDINRRFREHKNAKKQLKIINKLYSAIKKYGFENFIFDIIDYGYSESELNSKEIYYINAFNSVENGYNLTNGGKHHKFSEETKLKISKIKKDYFKNNKHHRIGSKITEQHKNSIKQYMKNRVVTKETREKMSKSKIGISNNNKNKFTTGHTPWNKNKEASEDIKNKIKLKLFLKNKEKYGYIGIVPYKTHRWLARIYVKSHEKACKVFNDKLNAAIWFDEKQILFNGENAITNKSLGLL